MSDTTGFSEASAQGTATKTQVWVAFSPAGAVGSIHHLDNGYGVRMLNDSDYRGIYPTLDVAQSALHANMLPGSDRPEFKEH